MTVLCDIERDGSTKLRKQPVVQSLIERGFIVPSEEPLARVKLTALAQQRLSKRGVGLNEFSSNPTIKMGRHVHLIPRRDDWDSWHHHVQIC